MFMEQAFGFQNVEGLVIMGAQFGILDFDIAHGGMGRAVPHHPGQHQQRHAATGHVGAEAVPEAMRVSLRDAARTAVIAKDAA
jgi:hypothetical protein